MDLVVGASTPGLTLGRGCLHEDIRQWPFSSFTKDLLKLYFCWYAFYDINLGWQRFVYRELCFDREPPENVIII